MRQVVILGLAVAMIAGSAAAQGAYGTFAPDRPKTGGFTPPTGYTPKPPPTFGAKPSYGVPAAPAYGPATPRPTAPSITEGGAGFKPYEPPKPFTGQSTYGLPKPAKPRF